MDEDGRSDAQRRAAELHSLIVKIVDRWGFKATCSLQSDVVTIKKCGKQLKLHALAGHGFGLFGAEHLLLDDLEAAREALDFLMSGKEL